MTVADYRHMRKALAGLGRLCLRASIVPCALFLLAAVGPAWSQTAPSAAAAAVEAETLALGGAVLADELVDPGNATLDKLVQTNGDPVDGTYVVLREHSTSRYLQRNNLGFFVAWDGDPDTLIDNRFPVEDGRIRFKILRDSVGDVLFPLSVSIGYRTAGAFKTGHFTIGSGQ